MKTLHKPQYYLCAVWYNEVYVLDLKMSSSEKRTAADVCCDALKETDWPCSTGEEFISCWHFLSMSFLLCKHEAVPTAHDATQHYWLTNTHRHTNHYIFIWTCEASTRHTQVIFLSHTHIGQILTHTGKWQKATPFPMACFCFLLSHSWRWTSYVVLLKLVSLYLSRKVESPKSQPGVHVHRK